MGDIRQVCIVTGANSGIGFETALQLAALDYEVILACRNQHKGNAAVAKIQQQIPECQVSFMYINLASLKSVRDFVENFHKSGKKLHILINNAGIFLGMRDISTSFTENGFELTFGINHLGHYLLTLLLLDDLKKNTPDARIVILTSLVHDPHGKGGGGKPAHIDFENLQLLSPGSFDSLLAFKNSKLANLLFAYELDRKLHGTGVTVNAVCPGFIPTTRLFRQNPVLKCYLICCCNILFRCCRVTRSKTKGAENVVFVATSEKLRGVGGKYFRHCEQAESSVESRDRDIAEKLFNISADLVNIDISEYFK